MLNTHIHRTVLAAAAAALIAFAPAASAADKRDLSRDNLIRMEEQARTGEDFLRVARMYEQRVEMLESRAAKHDKLEQRYAAAPDSLIAKRGYAWNTPRRQADMAAQARRDAAAARERAQALTAAANGAPNAD